MTKKEIKDTLKRNIKDLRHEHRLTQQEFADRLGITRARVGAIEEGRCIATFDLLFKISSVFGIETSKLINLKPNVSNWIDNEVVISVMAELARAEGLYSWKGNSIVKNALILSEEAGEVSRAVLQYVDENGSLDAVKSELHQTAAMCFRMLKNLPQ